MSKERLQKFLSRAGIASRRASEELILAGRVRVNGKVVKELGVSVDVGADSVYVDGKRIEAPEEKIYLAMYKPAGFVTTRKDEYGRKTVYDLLPDNLRQMVWSVGRLDADTEGLLVFTNDGDLTQKLTHPSFEHEKEYEVLLDKEVTSEHADSLRQGVDLDGQLTAPARVTFIDPKRVVIIIHEGRKRQVRKMFSMLGYKVLSLKRLREGMLALDKLNLEPGEVKEVSRDAILK